MPSRRPARPAMFNTPAIRTGGFGALQVEAVTNRPLSIARRHLAASQLRMRDIEPDELSSSELVQFLVMAERERDRWISDFTRRRSNSASSRSSSSGTPDGDRELAYDKAEEAREEAREHAERLSRVAGEGSSTAPTGSTPAVSLWVRQYDSPSPGESTGRRSPFGPASSVQIRRAAAEVVFDAPPTYESTMLASTSPPAYEPRSDDGYVSP